MPDFLNPVKGFGVTFRQMFRKVDTVQYPEEKKPTAPRFHGRHQLNRWPDGLEKCIGCELCAWACPADAIYVEGADNTDEERYSPGERYGERLPDQLPALHPVRAVRGGVPDPRADHDQRVRARRRQQGKPDLDQGAAAGAAGVRAWRRRRTRCGWARPSGTTTCSARPACGPGMQLRHATADGSGRTPAAQAADAGRRTMTRGGPVTAAHLLAAGQATSTEASVTFWVLAMISVAAALGMVLARRAVHCAVLLAVVMLSLAVLYAIARCAVPGLRADHRLHRRGADAVPVRAHDRRGERGRLDAGDHPGAAARRRPGRRSRCWCC